MYRMKEGKARLESNVRQSACLTIEWVKSPEWKLVNLPIQLLVCLKNRVGARLTVSAIKLKGAGVNDQLACRVMADCIVGMAVDQTVCFWEVLNQAWFNVHAVSAKLVAMREAYLKAAQLKGKLLWQGRVRREVAAIAVDSVDCFAPKDIESKDINDVTRMDDNLAVSKAATDSSQEI